MMSSPKVACCSRLMPSPQVCAKCKQVASAEGDSWCSGCSAWEFIGREISATWDLPGARLLASDLLVSCARQIKALRSLSSGISREPVASGAGSGRASVVPPEEGRGRREELPRRRSIPPPPPAKEEFDSDEEVQESGEEESERDPTPEIERPRGGGDRRPPEPEGPPPGRSHNKSQAGSTRASEVGDSGRGRERRGRGEERHSKRRKRSSGHRGGRKHQRLGRLAQDPFLRVHRKPPTSFWELQTPGKEAFEPSQLGR